MKQNKFYAIDPVKLQKAIDEKGLQKSQMSVDMGYSRNFLSHVMDRKKISFVGANLLKSLFNIPIEEYETIDIAPEPEPEPQPELLESGIDYERLEQAIYSAIVRAFTEN